MALPALWSGDRIVEMDFILRPDRLRRVDLEALGIAD
jgi:hypothetical protein